MHSSGGPPWVGGAAKGEAPALGKDAGAGALPKADAGGGAPKALDGAAPLTGGKAGSFTVPTLPGSGAGNAPCARTCPALNVTAATAAKTADLKIQRCKRLTGVAGTACELRKANTGGAINGRIIKAVPSGLQASSRQENDSGSAFYDCCKRLTTRGMGQERGAWSPLTGNNRAISSPLG
jgi:hypothetical protein